MKKIDLYGHVTNVLRMLSVHCVPKEGILYQLHLINMLHLHHLEYLTDRGVYPQVAKEVCQSLSQSQAALILGYDPKAPGFSYKEEFSQVHPDTPMVCNGKPRKWLSGKGDKYGSGFQVIYPLGAADGATPLAAIITEGLPKALVIAQEGYLAINLFGVDAWGNTKDGVKPGILEAIGQLPVYLAFDGDFRTNKDVSRALSTLADRVGAKVLSWEGAKGIDDYMAPITNRQETFQSLIEDSLSMTEIVGSLAQEKRVYNSEADPKRELERYLISCDHGLIIPQQKIRRFEAIGYKWDEGSNGFKKVELGTELYRKAIDFLDNSGQEAYSKSKGTYFKSWSTAANMNHANSSLDAGKIYHEMINTPFHTLDEDQNRIRFDNGVYDLRSNTLSVDRTYLSKSVGYSLVPGATPYFDKFLSTSYKSYNPHILIAALRYLMDVSPKMRVADSEGGYKEVEKFIHLQGESGTGKGIFCSIIAALMGDKAGSGKLEHANTPEDMAKQLGDSWLLIDRECSGVMKHTDALLSIVSGEPQKLRRLYHDAYEDKLKRRVLVAGISPVVVTAADGAEKGWARRILVLRTSLSSAEAALLSIDSSKILSEIPAIAARVLSMPFEEACQWLDFSDAVTPSEHKSGSCYATQFLELHINNSGEFGAPVKTSEVYAMYRIWVSTYFPGTKAKNINWFRDKMKKVCGGELHPSRQYTTGINFATSFLATLNGDMIAYSQRVGEYCP